jgi:hypothetical protein
LPFPSVNHNAVRSHVAQGNVDLLEMTPSTIVTTVKAVHMLSKYTNIS